MNTNNLSSSFKPKRLKLKDTKKKSFSQRLKDDMKKNYLVYIIFTPAFLYLLLFHYIPMFGIVIAFEDFKVARGVLGSDWVGLQNFVELFTGESFPLVIRNTAAMATLNLTIGYIVPVIFAIILSEVRLKSFKRVVQTISYAPYFVAAVVVAQLVTEFLGNKGAITNFLTFLGFERQNWLANANIPVFWFINTFTDLWQFCGYGAIVFVAAISNINPQLYEAAAIDGATRWNRIWRITLPSILPTVIILFTVRVGLVFTQGFNKILLLYKPIIYDTADTIVTYTYRMAFGTQINYGIAAASGLFQSIVATALLLISNKLNKSITKTSLF